MEDSPSPYDSKMQHGRNDGVGPRDHIEGFINQVYHLKGNSV